METLLGFTDGSLRQFLIDGTEPTFAAGAVSNAAVPLHAADLAAEAPPITYYREPVGEGMERFRIKIVGEDGREIFVLLSTEEVDLTPSEMDLLAKVATSVSLRKHRQSESDS